MWWDRKAQLFHISWWDDDTIWLIDALAYLYGETLVRAVPTARWELCPSNAGHIYAGEPIIERLPLQVHPVVTLTGLSAKPFTGTASTLDLADAFDRAVEA